MLWFKPFGYWVSQTICIMQLVLGLCLSLGGYFYIFYSSGAQGGSTQTRVFLLELVIKR